MTMIGLAAVVGVVAGSAQAGLPPLSVYAADPAIAHVAMSPDGSVAALAVVKDGKKLVHLMPRASGAGTYVPANAVDIRGLEFISPDHLMIFHSTVLDGDLILPRQRTFQGVVFDLKTQKSVTLLDDTPSTVAILTGGVINWGRLRGRPTVYVRALRAGPTFGLMAADAETGRGELLAAGDFNAESWVTTPEGAPVGRLSANPDTHRSDLWVKGPGSWRKIAFAADELIVLHGLGRRPDSVVVTRGNDLVEVGTNGGVTGPLQPPGLGVEGIIFDPVSRLMIAAQVTGPQRYVFFDDRLAKAWARVAKPFRGSTVGLAGLSDGFDQVLVVVEGPKSPGDIYWADLPAGKAELLGSARPDMPAVQIAAQRPFAFAASDGLQLGGYLTLPPGREAKELPAVVLVHDGPDGLDQPGFAWLPQAIASRGYAVVQVNFRGSGGAGPGIEQAGVGQWGRRMQTDLSDAVAHLAAEGTIDTKRTCIAGRGYGGYAALAGVTLQHEVYRCAVAIDAIADVRSSVQPIDAYERSGRSGQIANWRRFIGVDGMKNAALDALSPIKYAAKGAAPVLLVYESTGDLAQGRRMRGALAAAKRDATLVTLDVQRQDLGTEAGRLALLQATLDFLARTNPA